MTFRWVSRLDDELQWTWDESEKAVFTDKFQQRFPKRLARGVLSGRPARESAVSTQWQITSGASWDEGDLLRLNDPDNNDFDLRELTGTTETVLAVAAADVSSGENTRSELDGYLSRQNWDASTYLNEPAGESASLEFRWDGTNERLYVILRGGRSGSDGIVKGWRVTLFGGATFTGFTDISLEAGTNETVIVGDTVAESTRDDFPGAWGTAVTGDDEAYLDVSGATSDTTLRIDAKLSDVPVDESLGQQDVVRYVSYGTRRLGTNVREGSWTVPLEGGDRPFPPVWNVTEDMLFAVTDVNGTSPTTAHIGTQAALDNSSGWQIDVSGVGDVEIERIDTVRGEFIVKFLATRIQTNPAEDS